jgi:hypothetical protein
MGCPTLIMSNQNLNNRHHNNDSSQTNVWLGNARLPKLVSLPARTSQIWGMRWA